MMPGYGETLIVEGDPAVDHDRDALIEAFRHQLDEGMWAAVPVPDPTSGRREAIMVSTFEDVPRDAERVLFWPRAAGGAAPKIR
jgi:hypothetical protein